MRNTEPRHINLNMLINRLRESRFVVPDFQREFKWQPQDIRGLMRSIFLDYYIGGFLFWKGKEDNFKLLSCKTIYGFNGRTKQTPWNKGPRIPEYIVLDGQQRLAALYYAFVAPNIALPERKNRLVYFIHMDKFMDEHYDEAFRYDWHQSRSEKIMNSREFQYKKHIFPLSIIGDDDYDLRDWVQNYEEYWKKRAAEAETRQDISKCEYAIRYIKNISVFGRRIKSIIEEYQIAYIELDEDLAIDKVCNIFTQTNIQANSCGVQLDVFDFISALLKPKGLQLEKMCRETWPEEELKLSRIKERKMKAYVLQTMSILLQKYCSAKDLYFLVPGQEKPACDPKGEPKKEILIPDTDSFKKHWDEAVSAITSAIKVLKNPREFGDISSKYFPPCVSILPVFAALQVKRQALPSDMQLEAQRKIQHWYWASVFTNRYSKYSGSIESTSARDFIDVTAWIDNREDGPALIQESKDLIRSFDLRSKTKKGTTFYNCIFNLLILQGAKDWMDGIPLKQHKDLNDHHIVPASWGKHLNDSNFTINSILNRTPLNKKTNSNIGNRLPNEYLKKLIEENGEAQSPRHS